MEKTVVDIVRQVLDAKKWSMHLQTMDNEKEDETEEESEGTDSYFEVQVSASG